MASEFEHPFFFRGGGSCLDWLEDFPLLAKMPLLAEAGVLSEAVKPHSGHLEREPPQDQLTAVLGLPRGLVGHLGPTTCTMGHLPPRSDLSCYPGAWPVGCILFHSKPRIH